MKPLSIKTKRTLTTLGMGIMLGLAVGYLAWGYKNTRGEVIRRYSEDKKVRVARVIDGDTIALSDGMHVRYIGCDTAESYRIIHEPKPLAEAATKRNRELLEGAWVYLHLGSPDAPLFDAHGRLLAEVFVGGENVSVGEKLVSEGMARSLSWALGKNQLQRYKNAESLAREKKLGLWADKKISSGVRFVASRSSKIYHTASCIHAGRIKPDNIVRFETTEDAIGAGKTACPMCLGSADK